VEQRWIPPFVVYALRNADGTVLQANIDPPMNLLGAISFEDHMYQAMIKQINSARESHHWQTERAAVTLVDKSAYASAKQAKIRESWLEETAKLALAVTYAFATLVEAPGGDWPRLIQNNKVKRVSKVHDGYFVK